MREDVWLRRWYGQDPPPWHLRALSWVYRGLRALALLPARFSAPRPTPVPVIVVGNLSVGGSGKTPLVIALVEGLRARGFSVGVVSRGYGRITHDVRLVDRDASAEIVGDEPLMIARRGIPIAVGVDRVAALRRLTDAVPLDVVIADDGLDHWRLGRIVEIAVIDGARGFGNGWLLPAGPLRAPPSRLRRVDAIVRNGGDPASGEYAMRVVIDGYVALGGGRRVESDHFRGQRAHVIAGVGNPARIFDACRARGIDVIEHPMPDHVASDALNALRFDDDLPRIYTEKDAVKLAPGASGWRMSTSTQIDARLLDTLVGRLQK